MGKEERELQMAYSEKEKMEKLLSNLEKLSEEGSVTDEQYGSMKSNYTHTLNEAISEIEQVKNRLSRDLESEERALKTYNQELSNLEVKFKVGELSADVYQKSEQRTRGNIEKIQTKISELKRLFDSKSSADVGGYIEIGERKKAVSAGVRVDKGERIEAILRIPLAMVYGIILGVWGFVVEVLWIIHWLYALILGKRHMGIAEFTNKYISYAYYVYRYLLFATNERPWPIGGPRPTEMEAVD